MTDRELLELAAKAAGLDRLLGAGFDSPVPYWLGDPKQPEPRYWNPLIDDGDALRLAVKLDFRIDVDKDRAWAAVTMPRHLGIDSILETNENGDPYAAARRAIVRAAAEIGKSMK